jgi:AP endonuclease-2
MPDVPGSDHCPVYADFRDSITLEDGSTRDLWREMNPGREPESSPPDPPKFAARFFDEFSGKQKLLSSFFIKRSTNGGGCATVVDQQSKVSEPTLQDARNALLSAAAELSGDPSPTPDSEPTLEDARRALASTAEEAGSNQSSASPISIATESKTSSSTQPVPQVEPVAVQMPLSRSQSIQSTSESRPRPLKRTSSDLKSSNSKGKEKLKGQQTLAAFIKRPASKPKGEKEASTSQSSSNGAANDLSRTGSAELISIDIDSQDSAKPVEPPPPLSQLSEAAESSQLAAGDFKTNFNTPSTSAAWSSLLTPKAIPRCTMHGDPAKEWTVSKPGPNKGRKFWLCSRGVGAKGDPEARFVLLDFDRSCLWAYRLLTMHSCAKQMRFLQSMICFFAHFATLW